MEVQRGGRGRSGWLTDIGLVIPWVGVSDCPRSLGSSSCTEVPRYLSRDAISWPPAVGGSELLKQPSTSTPSHCTPYFPHGLLLLVTTADARNTSENICG